MSLMLGPRDVSCTLARTDGNGGAGAGDVRPVRGWQAVLRRSQAQTRFVHHFGIL